MSYIDSDSAVLDISLLIQNPKNQPGQIRGDETSSRCLRCAVNKPPRLCWLWQCWIVPLMFLWTPPVPISSPCNLLGKNLKPESKWKVCLQSQTHVHQLCAIRINKLNILFTFLGQFKPTFRSHSLSHLVLLPLCCEDVRRDPLLFTFPHFSLMFHTGPVVLWSFMLI